MSTLIEVESNLLHALESLVAAEELGEPPDELSLAMFRDAALYAAEKRDHVAQAFAFLAERIEGAKAREKEAQRRRRTLEDAHERLAGYVLGVLAGKGISVAMGNEAKFVITTTESVHVANPDALPDELCRIKTVREPDKAKIREALEGGVRIELAAGAHIQNRDTLKIRPLAVKDRPGDTLLKNREEIAP